MKGVLRCLRYTKAMKILVNADCDLIFQGASDADWSGDGSDRKSTAGQYYKLTKSGGAFSWNCGKQNTADFSSCEADYRGLCAAVQEAMFLRQLMQHLFITQVEATPIAEDNERLYQIVQQPSIP